MKNSISFMSSPTCTLRVHFHVIFPAELNVPSMLWIVCSLSNFCVGSSILDIVLGSRKFSVAPLSTSVFSVSCVVNKINLIIKAFLFAMNICRILSAHAATTSRGDFKNPPLPKGLQISHLSHLGQVWKSSTLVLRGQLLLGFQQFLCFIPHSVHWFSFSNNYLLLHH